MQRLALLFSLTYCFSIFAGGSTGPAKGFLTCPAPSALLLNKSTRKWSANGGWKSFDTSFATEIKRFLGAQWVGINLGRVTCLYEGAYVGVNGLSKTTFDVRLQHAGLAKTPSGGSWSKDKGGYKNCKANHIEACQFKGYHQGQEQNIYKSLDSLKSTPESQVGY